jgi:segregation and condensation protein A
MPNTPHTEYPAAQPPAPPTANRPVSGAPGSPGPDQPFSFSLTVGQLYDGPLDLLLALIRKQDVDICDIPIAKITAQFLAYVGQFHANEVDTAAEFVYMAAQLIHIKSKLLLPRPTEDFSQGKPEDPCRDLVNQLLEHERFKQAAQMLQQKEHVEQAIWSNPGIREFLDEEYLDDTPAQDVPTSSDSVNLVSVFRQILDRTANRPTLTVEQDSVSVAQMVDYLRRRLLVEDQPITLTTILNDSPSARLVTATFLALLEMVRLGAVLLHQDRICSDIRIKKTKEFEQVMSQSFSFDEQWT